MRHELNISGWVITSDNSAGIGEKAMDAVAASDHITAKFAARVALLEQWAAGSEPKAVLLHNFSGQDHWHRYVGGIEEIFREAGQAPLPITGSSETNMETLQSGVAVTMFGKRMRETATDSLEWFAYGKPLVGNEVLENSGQVADLKKIHTALSEGIIERIWPVGSKGITREMELLMGRIVKVTGKVDAAVSGGPATCVLVGVRDQKIAEAQHHFGSCFFPLQIK